MGLLRTEVKKLQEEVAQLQVQHPIGKSPNELRLNEKNFKLVQRQEELYAENDKLKEELLKMKQKQQPAPSARTFSEARPCEGADCGPCVWAEGEGDDNDSSRSYHSGVHAPDIVAYGYPARA